MMMEKSIRQMWVNCKLIGVTKRDLYSYICTTNILLKMLRTTQQLSYCRFHQVFSHITMVSGCDRELNAHFYSAASLKYHAPDT